MYILYKENAVDFNTFNFGKIFDFRKNVLLTYILQYMLYLVQDSFKDILVK